MKEALRLVAPVTILVRKTVKDTVVQGVAIPKDADVIVGVQYSHLMEEHWTDPMSFDPDRFSEERREDKSHRYAWEPFGGGVHKCIGLYFAGAEIKTILHQLLRTHEWSVDPSYVVPMDYHSLPFPKDGQPIDLRRRVEDHSHVESPWNRSHRRDRLEDVTPMTAPIAPCDRAPRHPPPGPPAALRPGGPGARRRRVRDRHDRVRHAGAAARRSPRASTSRCRRPATWCRRTPSGSSSACRC